MSSTPVTATVGNMRKPIAPWWHTALVLLVLLMGSAASAHQQGLPNLKLPGMSVRLSGYLTVIAEEWLLVLLIWLVLKRRGLSIGSLVSGCWQNLGAFLKDLGLAVGFLLVVVAVTGVLARLLSVDESGPASIVPKTSLEAITWLFLSATGGFCEELIFRGYLTCQFTAWTNSTALAIVIQSVVFGLSHGYQIRNIVVIVILGCLLGMLAYWRKSLRPGMLAHGLQDALGGMVSFFFMK